MGEPSSIWLRINKEKGKILASNTTSGTCALYNFQPCVYKKKTWTLSFSIYSTYILILNIGLCDSVLTSWWNSLEKVLCPSCTVSLLTCLSIYLSVLSVCFICSSVCLSFCFTACLSSWLSVCYMSVCLSVCYVYMINTPGWYCPNLSYLFVCLSVFLSASLLACLHDCLSAIYLSVCLLCLSDK